MTLGELASTGGHIAPIALQVTDASDEPCNRLASIALFQGEEFGGALRAFDGHSESIYGIGGENSRLSSL